MLGITGATGVLGRLICERLARENIVYTAYKNDICDYRDVCEWVSENNINRIIHLAAIVPTNTVESNPLRAYEVNVVGTFNLLKAFAKETTSDKWFFYASTSHVYQNSDAPLTEESVVAPISLYGKTKYLAECIVLHGVPKNIKTCVGRIFSFYDDSQVGSFLYPTLKKRFVTEDLTQPFFLRGAASVRDFLPAQKVAEIIFDIMRRAGEGIFNIGSGKGSTISEFAQKKSPVPLLIVSDGTSDHLVADVSKLNEFLRGTKCLSK